MGVKRGADEAHLEESDYEYSREGPIFTEIER